MISLTLLLDSVVLKVTLLACPSLNPNPPEEEIQLFSVYWSADIEFVRVK